MAAAWQVRVSPFTRRLGALLVVLAARAADGALSIDPVLVDLLRDEACTRADEHGDGSLRLLHAARSHGWSVGAVDAYLLTTLASGGKGGAG